MKPIQQAQTSSYLKPINPNLDVSIIDQITTRQYYPPVVSTASAISPSPTP